MVGHHHCSVFGVLGSFSWLLGSFDDENFFDDKRDEIDNDGQGGESGSWQMGYPNVVGCLPGRGEGDGFALEEGRGIFFADATTNRRNGRCQ